MEWLNVIHPKRPSVADFRPGDEVRVWYRIMEQGKERLGQFEGVVIRARGSWPSKTFTVRRVTYGEGVERCFPADAKTIARIEVLRRGKVKRSRLYFLRAVVGKTRLAQAGNPSGVSASSPSSSAPNTKPSSEAGSSPPTERVVAAAPSASGPATNA